MALRYAAAACSAPVAAAASAEAPPASTAQPAAPKPVATHGVLLLPPDAEGHRVFVDGDVVAVKSSRSQVPCGSREVRIGSRGTARQIDIACGGETTLPPEPRDR